MNELKSFLLKQKYPEKLIDSGIHKALRTVSEQHMNLLLHTFPLTILKTLNYSM